MEIELNNPIQKIEKTTRLIRCPNCGKKKAITVTQYNEITNLTTISFQCVTENCKIFSVKHKQGNTLSREIL